MKRVISFLLVFIFMFSFAGCSEESKLQKTAEDYIFDYIVNGSFKDPSSARIIRVSYNSLENNDIVAEAFKADGTLYFTVQANNSYGATATADYLMLVGGDNDKECFAKTKKDNPNDYSTYETALDPAKINQKLEKHWKSIGIS